MQYVLQMWSRKMLFQFCFGAIFLFIVGNAHARRSIPRIIFRSHEEDLADLNPKFTEIFSNVLQKNINYSMVYFSEAERIQFIKAFYPQYLKDYSALVPGAFRSDVWRLLILYRYGGIYSDLSIQYIQKIDDIVRMDDEFVGVIDLDPKTILNCFIAAYPQHPLILKMIEIVMDNVRNRRYNCQFLDITGPKALGRAYNAFFGDFENVAIQSSNFSRQGFKFRFFGFSATPTWVISEAGSVVVMRNKFEGYKGLIYRNNTMPYNELYFHHKIFTDDGARDRNKDFLLRNYLYRNRSSLRYVYEKKEYMFPNFPVFVAMGFEVCMSSREVAPFSSAIDKYPKILLPSDVLDAIHMVNLWGRTNYSFFAENLSVPMDYGGEFISKRLTSEVGINLRQWLTANNIRGGENSSVIRFKEFMLAVEKEALNDDDIRTAISF